MKKGVRTFIFYAIFIVAVVIFSTVLLGDADSDKFVYSDMLSHFKEDKVAEFVVDSDNLITMKLTDETTVQYTIRDIYLFEQDVSPYLEANTNLVKYDYETPTVLPWWMLRI